MNDVPILFRETEEIDIMPENETCFFVSEIYDLLCADEYEDLDRIEVYNGAIYCRCVEDDTMYSNEFATQFWYNNAAFLNREEIRGHAVFVPNDMDIYGGMDTIHVE